MKLYELCQNREDVLYELFHTRCGIECQTTNERASFSQSALVKKLCFFSSLAAACAELLDEILLHKVLNWRWNKAQRLIVSVTAEELFFPGVQKEIALEWSGGNGLIVGTNWLCDTRLTSVVQKYLVQI